MLQLAVIFQVRELLVKLNNKGCCDNFAINIQ